LIVLAFVGDSTMTRCLPWASTGLLDRDPPLRPAPEADPPVVFFADLPVDFFVVAPAGFFAVAPDEAFLPAVFFVFADVLAMLLLFRTAEPARFIHHPRFSGFRPAPSFDSTPTSGGGSDLPSSHARREGLPSRPTRNCVVAFRGTLVRAVADSPDLADGFVFKAHPASDTRAASVRPVNPDPSRIDANIFDA
jgi:hypothetical protein